MERSQNGLTTPDNRNTPGDLILRIFILIFILGYLTLAIYLVFNGWTDNFERLQRFLGLKKAFSPLLHSCLFAICGAMMGIGVLDLLHFHKHVAVLKDFDNSHSWGFIFAPWLSVILGLLVCALVKSGLFVFGGSIATDTSEIADLGHLAIGFIAGYGWFQLTGVVQSLVSKLFNESTRRPSSTEAMRDRREPHPPGAPPGSDSLGQ
jgi:hypothetical protein